MTDECIFIHEIGAWCDRYPIAYISGKEEELSSLHSAWIIRREWWWDYILPKTWNTDVHYNRYDFVAHDVWLSINSIQLYLCACTFVIKDNAHTYILVWLVRTINRLWLHYPSHANISSHIYSTGVKTKRHKRKRHAVHFICSLLTLKSLVIPVHVSVSHPIILLASW